MKMQGTRIEDQRSSLPGEEAEGADNDLNLPVPSTVVAPTMPDEDFFSLICRIQGGRLEEQRAYLPGGGNWPDRQEDSGTTNGHGPTEGTARKTSDL